MKKANVLQLAFIITGIALGISALQYFLETLATYLLFLFNNSDSISSSLYAGISLGILLSAGFKALICWLLITQSGKLASFISNRAGFGSGFQIIGKANNLLYILLVTVGIFLLLSNVTPLLKGIVNGFKTKSSAGLRDLYENLQPTDWTSVILNIILPLVFLMFARSIADYFAKNVNDQEVTVEDSDDKTDLLESTQD